MGSNSLLLPLAGAKDFFQHLNLPARCTLRFPFRRKNPLTYKSEGCCKVCFWSPMPRGAGSTFSMLPAAGIGRSTYPDYANAVLDGNRSAIGLRKPLHRFEDLLAYFGPRCTGDPSVSTTFFVA